jgi:hypothetical protein
MDTDEHESAERGSVTRSSFVGNQDFALTGDFFAVTVLRLREPRSAGMQFIRVNSCLSVAKP